MVDDDFCFDDLDEADSVLSFHETPQEAPGRFQLTTLGFFPRDSATASSRVQFASLQ